MKEKQQGDIYCGFSIHRWPIGWGDQAVDAEPRNILCAELMPPCIDCCCLPGGAKCCIDVLFSLYWKRGEDQGSYFFALAPA